MRDEKKIAALILAGGTVSPEMQAVAEGATNRALIPVAGRPMLDYVLEALRGGFERAGTQGRILIAGEIPPVPGCDSVPGGASLVDTLLSGASALRPDETRLLVSTADIPFLTAEAVADLLQKADELGPADFVYPIVEAARCRERFPGMKRTTLRIAEGEFTGGNLVLIDPGFLRRQEGLLRAAYARRKSVTGLAGMLGPSLFLRLLGSRIAPSLLTIAHVEAAVSRALGGARVRAIISPRPEIGTDVDRPEDVITARNLLADKTSCMEDSTPANG